MQTELEFIRDAGVVVALYPKTEGDGIARGIGRKIEAVKVSGRWASEFGANYSLIWRSIPDAETAWRVSEALKRWTMSISDESRSMDQPQRCYISLKYVENGTLNTISLGDNDVDIKIISDILLIHVHNQFD